MGHKGSRDAFLYAFDLLELDGQDLVLRAMGRRRATLRSLLRRTRQGIRFSEHLICPDGTIAFHHACRMGFKGVVAKREIGLPFWTG